MQTTNHRCLGWMALGILIGFLLTALMPARPLHAVATDGTDSFALATGQVDTDVEGVFFLDSLTGDLKGAVINLVNGKFTTFFEYNVLKDLEVDVAKSPKFLMVTGVAQMRRGPTQYQPAQSVVYVAEANSGVCVAYGMQWNKGRTNQPIPQVQQGNFIPLDKVKFRTVAIRPQ